MFIGTTNRGNTYPGAVLPWGMVAVTPHNNYHDSVKLDNSVAQKRRAVTYLHGEPFIYGFGHLALSGIGCHESGSIVFMPTTGEPVIGFQKNKSKYSKEVAEPGYYSVFLDDYQIHAESTADVRSGITRYTFPKGRSNLILDLSFCVSHIKDGFVRVVSSNEIEGYKIDGDFCDCGNQRKAYFVAKISKKNSKLDLFKDNLFVDSGVSEVEGKVGASFSFETSSNEMVELQVGISYVSIANARLNLESEIANKSFEEVRQHASETWDKELSKIRVEGGSEDDKAIFYTALYHVLLNPHVFNDANGEYVTMGHNGVANAGSRSRYTVFSLWDTYRTTHPLLTLIYPKQQTDMVRSMLDMQKENGWLPLWELHGHETNIMVGDPASIVIADSYIKGLTDFSPQEALGAMIKNATSGGITRNPVRKGIELYEKYGFIPNDLKAQYGVWGSVSTSLEYSLADWAIGQMALKMRDDSVHQKFNSRSMTYKLLWDDETKFFRPRNSDQSWMIPFNVDSNKWELPIRSNSGGPGFVEGSAWQYRFFAHHDIKGLIKLMGGVDTFASNLQSLFNDGKFDMNNEPDIAYPYLFNYVPGEEWRTQETVSQLIKKHFRNAPDGLPGNDDCGTLSAWLIFSMMGIYPDCPASPAYQVTKPSFKKISVYSDDNNSQQPTFSIINNTDGGDKPISRITINNIPTGSFQIDHSNLKDNSVITIE